MAVRENKGIWQLHWCIHGGVFMPLSLTDKAPANVAAELVAKTLKSLVEEKLALSELIAFEK